jgi:hypothetical protein
VTLDLDDHLLQTPDGLVAALLGNLIGKVVLGLISDLLGLVLGWHSGIILSYGIRGNAFLILK